MAPGMDLMARGLLFLLAAAFTRVSANKSYFLRMTSDGPVTSGALAIVNVSLGISNDGMILIVDPRLCHFHWIYSPLLLSHHIENDTSSAITLQCNTPGIFPVSVWVTERRCPSCEPIARNTTELQVTKDIVGHFTAIQPQAKGTSLRNGTFLATNSTVKLLFFIQDPSYFFKSAEFSYTWNFGDSTTVKTTEPFVYYSYSKPKNYNSSLQVTAHLHNSQYERHFQKKTGHFKDVLILQDIIRNITISGPSETNTEQNFSMALHFLGSPPLAVCWLMKSDCVSLDGEDCHPVVINGTTYNIKHIFKSAGRYCLSVKAQNEISMLLTHNIITVNSTGVHPLWFVLPCCALFAVAVGYIFYTLFKATSHNTQPKTLVEVADFDFSPVMDKYETLPDYREISAITCCTCCRPEEETEEEAETQPLLRTPSSSTRSYTT
ncbi:PREDICTED: transmembrane protein 130 [Nanorana parkeri]|uniref:transmembrane protein 130 n=1 Tax=Nanorana parkeri TaxID=125878 RepID=UPI000854C220|nr:PREDICTED: transmembrane protein 130 [Nanorana parkeri]